MSINHQYYEFSDNVVKRYVKTVPYGVTGWRLDPANKTRRVEFMLSNRTDQLRIVNKIQVSGEAVLTHVTEQGDLDYENDVLELYSDDELRTFSRFNKHLIENGLIKEFTESTPVIEDANFLSDTEVADIANIMNLGAFKKKISEITSKVTINRVLSSARELNRSANIINAIEARLDELSR